ncbi:MAG: glycosyltransferase family 2 protein [Betaproteobacteria bacterium]|nr:glycosyltransferase family 2 protein [Betaproteobacteria bacterium]
MNPELTILIVTWNSWADLKRCLESIRKASVPACEILVIDNGSEDGTPEKLQREFPEVRLERNATNLGLPAAVNRGLREVRGDFVMLLDVDTEVRPETPGLLLEFLRAHPEVALVAPRIYTPEGEIEQTARNLPSMMSGLFGRQSLLTRLFPGNPYTKRYLLPENLGRKDPFAVGQVSAACMFMRRGLADEAGPWDEGYRCYWVDSDWCAQVHRTGKAIYCFPAASIVHYENNRAHKKKSPWRIRHFHIGAYRFYRKHRTLGVLDPRAIVAAVALAIRAVVMMVLNELKGDSPARAPVQPTR